METAVVEQAMVSVKLFVMCISTMFLAIIGVYVWSFNISQKTDKKLSDIYRTVNGHIQEANIHVDKKEFVSADVCKVLHENMADDLTEIKKDIKTLIAKG